MAFAFFKKKEDKLGNEIERLEIELGMTDPESDEYAVIARNLETLYKIRENKNCVSADTIASIAGTLASIFAVMYYEQAGHFISSKAWGLIQKIKR